MLGIEFYCGNYDELRRMKELGGVETHCSRCKLISEQDLVKLLLCFYRFTALPRGKVLFAMLPRPLFYFLYFVFTCLIFETLDCDILEAQCCFSRVK